MHPVLAWIVQGDEGGTVADVLRAALAGLGGEADAASIGRVLLNGRVADSEHPVESGDRVEIWPRRKVSEERVEIVTQRDGVMFVSKPAGVPTETTKLNEDSVVTRLIERLNGGKVHAASRLDVQVSGLVLCTLGRDAARRVQRWREATLIRSRYLALTNIGEAELADEGVWDSPLGKSRDRGGRHRASSQVANAKKATTHYRVVARCGVGKRRLALLLFEPKTGRTHQLRAHASLAGVPLLGDGTYGGPRDWTAVDGAVRSFQRVMLHAWRVGVPTLGAEAPVPALFLELWRAEGGAEDVWDAIEATTVIDGSMTR